MRLLRGVVRRARRGQKKRKLAAVGDTERNDGVSRAETPEATAPEVAVASVATEKPPLAAQTARAAGFPPRLARVFLGLFISFLGKPNPQ